MWPLTSIKRYINHRKTTKRLKPMYAYIQSSLEAIRNLPICEITKRQPMLVDLLASLVASETQDGSLTGDRQLEANDWWATLGALLNDAGFERLGNGHFSAAYAHSLLPGRVIKVGFKKEDSGAAYAAFCRMHQGLAGIPVIHDIQRHPGCYTVVMDKLDSAEYARNCKPELNELYYQVREAVECNSWCDGHESDGIDAVREELGEHAAATIQTARMINKFFSGIASFDMHRGNIMQDAKGQLVITDPVSFSHDRERAKKQDFMIDPEELLKEVEALAAEKMIERCRQRKAKRDPEGIFWLQVKEKRQRIKKRKAKQAKLERELLKIEAGRRLESHNFYFGLGAINMMHGAQHLDDIWRRNNMKQLEGIAKQAADDMRVLNQWHIANGMPLVIDGLLQDRLIG